MTIGQWVGQWVGQWFGEWFGSGEPAPAGAMSGAATITLSTAGSATGKGALVGSAKPYVEQEFITTREAWLAVHTRRDEIPLYTAQDSHLVFSGVDRFDVIDRPIHEARQEPVRRSRLAAHEDHDVSILTVPLRFQMKTIQESIFAQTRREEGVVQDSEESVVVRDLGKERFTVRQSDILEMN